MRRLVLFLFVATISISTSGLIELVVPEQCSIEESTNQQDRDCASTCVRCHCARSIEVAISGLLVGSVPPVVPAVPPGSFVSAGSPSEILHVPKL